jgi:hypothetical protein
MSYITGVRHPYWTSKSPEWAKWRLVYDGGDQYVNKYLDKFSYREDDGDFAIRKKRSPRPNFAKAAINDIKNSIFQRLTEVARRDGSKSYQDAVMGVEFGVDLHGKSMNEFIGTELLSELLVMQKVGIFVDMPRIEGKTLADMVGKQPYIYKYVVEDILSWREKPGSPDEFIEILVRDHVEVLHENCGLPTGIYERYRHCWIGEDGKCHIAFYKELPPEKDPTTGKIEAKSVMIDADGNPTDQEMILDINYIPFVMIEISDSLIADVANHQIALLNMESSDVNYSLNSNFPFYTEQSDFRAQPTHLKGPGGASTDGTAASANAPKDDEVTVGATRGRRYGKDLDRPGFIHPSAEPLLASMKKQEQLKNDIRSLVNLSLSNMRPAFASAESKQMDERGLDSGLSSIGLVLQHCERRIAYYWHLLEGKKNTASIKYPEKWSLKSEQDRREEAKSLRELRETIPSETFQQAISYEIAILMLGHKVSNTDLKKIHEEIKAAKSYTSDPETIFKSVELGLCDLQLAAELLGLPKDAPKKAAKDHADRLARISEAQAKNQPEPVGNPGARGVTDMDPSPGQSGRDEKAASRDNTNDPTPSDKVRGEAKAEADL